MKLVDVPERHLPPDFADRLVRSLRRRKRARRIRAVAILMAALVLCTGIVSEVRGREERKPQTADRIYASQSVPTNDTKVSSLLMLGFFKECIKRTRSGKKKEEE